MMLYDAVGISAYDLAAGIDFVKEAGKKTKIPWLSANLLRASDHQPVFKPAIRRTIGATEVGIIGITDPAAHSQKNDDFMISPWQETLPNLVAEMNTSCDLLILLSSLPEKDNRQIAQEIDGIHIIFQTGSQNKPPFKVRNTLLTNTGKKGKYLGELIINWQPTKKWGLGKADELRNSRQKLDQVNWRLKRLKRKGLPAKGAEGNPRLLKDFHKLVAVREQLNATIIRLENSKEEAFCSYRNRFIALEKSLPEQPAVQAVIDRARKEVNKAGKKRRSPRPPTSLYTGSHRCASCHPDQHRGWEKSQHANSYRTLERQKQQFNLDCLPCHVTGINEANLQHALALPKDQQQVGCEACHGIGTEHVKTEGKRPLPAPAPGAETCLRCHTPEHSDDFNFQRDRHLVH